MVGMNEINRNYPLINSYGVVGDCHSVALVSPDGSVDWGCLPDFDSPTILGAFINQQRAATYGYES